MMKRFRQEGALKRLQDQLESGVKTQKGTTDVKVELTDKDVKRINGEIHNLKENMK